MKTKYKFTVFMTTYNRRSYMQRVYECLERQTYKNFEWLIIDDGSTDGTEEEIESLKEKSSFPITYIWQENGGRHRAHNHALRYAQGEFFMHLDSDDLLTENALERFMFYWDSIPGDQRSNFAGVGSLCAGPYGKIIGTKYPKDLIDSNTNEIYWSMGVKGDKSFVFLTNIIKQYPYPDFDGEPWIPPGVIYNQMGRKYKMRFFNEVLRIKEYLPKGISSKGYSRILKAIKSANGYRLSNMQALEFINRKSLCRLLKQSALVVRFSLHLGYSLKEQLSPITHKFIYILSSPIGLLLFFRDRIILKRESQ